ncbi:hypothetical protein [Microbacterium sp. SORGH_AS_0888]|uniref:hypothetical protein n=1 Tax=Microbacterium sp. SORGH_AS_0888 TaxID=3041791 RepID=UPI00277E9E50|nr:hypothetical protein [Microbacterium sp. SORGH_AS_0888]MDQ1131135.1 hypothetical protein [Microbacterium sp. SORGH_AS_0888]
MARVDDHNHLGRRDLLVACWNHVPVAIGLLSPKARWELHRFYAPSRDLTDDEFLAHMKQVLASEPSLAQRVGKHYRLIFTVYKRYADQVGKTNFSAIEAGIRRDYARKNWDPSEKRRIMIMPLVNPDIDYEKLARALLEQADRERRGEFRDAA